MNPEVDAYYERVRIGNLTPHKMTLTQFVEIACAIPVPNHPRRWEVSHGRYLSWAEGDTADEAKATVHKREVENALRHNLPASSALPYRPDIPTTEVLTDYPDLRLTYAEAIPVQP